MTEPRANTQTWVLGLAVFATGFSGLMAEYSVSTVVAYLTGDTIAAYSLLIGVFMAAMGVGAFASERMSDGDELARYLLVEVLLSVCIATSSLVITQLAIYDLTWPGALFIAGIIGTLIGFEIPLLVRFNDKRNIVLKRNIAVVLGADYLGAFVASIAFIGWFLPVLGAIATPAVAGAVNLAIAALVAIVFREHTALGRVVTGGVVAGIVVGGVATYGDQVVFAAEQKQYGDPIIFSEQTPFQKIVVTRFKNEYCLFLNGQTQMCTSDERRYHEALIHPALWLKPDARNALVMGGGDGLAVRELLRYPGIESITLVDLDPRVVEIARELPPLVAANEGSLTDERVHVVNADGYSWVGDSRELFDVIVIDLPDPGNVALARLYSREFYTAVRDHMSPDGVMVTQSASPIHANETFAIIWRTIDDAGLQPLPYRVNVPSFGDWGFNVAVRDGQMTAGQMAAKLDRFDPPVQTTFLNNSAMVAATRFEKGIFPDDTDAIPVSRLMQPTVYQAYQRAWKRAD